MLAFGVLLLVLADAPQSQLLRVGAGQEPEAISLGEVLTPWGRFPVSRRDPPSIERMARRISPLRLVRVRARQGTFIGQVAEVRSVGLISLAPDTKRSWSGPVDLLPWDDIGTIEVRRRSPVRTAAAGIVIGATLGAIAGITYTKVNGGDDFAALVLCGLAGGLAGGPVGFGVGCAVPIWEPLYSAR